MKFCPKCGTPREVRFCTRCGFAFDEDSFVVETSAVAVVTPQQTSLKYGDGYSADTHCTNCGNPKAGQIGNCTLCDAAI